MNVAETMNCKTEQIAPMNHLDLAAARTIREQCTPGLVECDFLDLSQFCSATTEGISYLVDLEYGFVQLGLEEVGLGVARYYVADAQDFFSLQTVT